MPEPGRSRRARVVTAAAISAAVVVAGGGAVAYATSQNTTTPYVTATAGSHSVLQSLQATGTTEPSRWLVPNECLWGWSDRFGRP